MTRTRTRETPASPAVAARIAADTPTVRGELARAESKAGVLASIAGAALTVILAAQTLHHELPVAALAVLGAAAATNAAAIVLLAWVLKPDLGGGGGGWLGYADLTAAQVRRRAAGHTGYDDDAQLAFLAGLACRKYRHIRAAVFLLLVVVALVLLAAGITTGARILH